MSNKEFILKLVKYFCFGLLLFGVFMLSFCMGFYYRDSNHTLKISAQSLQTADTSTPDYTFTSSNFPMLIYEGITGSSYGHLDYFPCVFTLNHSYFNVTYYTYYNGSLSITLGQNNPLSYDTNVRYDYNNGTQNGSFEYYISSNFDCNPLRFSVGLLDSYFGDSSYYESYILFVDSNNNTFQLGWRVPKSWSTPNGTYSVVRGRYGYSNRTYFLSSSLSDNEAYNAGLDAGSYQGSLTGFQSGYTTGYTKGYDVGEEAGKIIGRNEAHQFTFFNLFGAIFDVPIAVLTGMLNFDLLGINLLSFVTAILTLALILRLIRWISGGR